MTDNHEEEPIQFVLLIYRGTTHLPNTPEYPSHSDDEQKAIYADCAALNKIDGLSPVGRTSRGPL
jgi:hypothetical protein